jgi:tRNA (guanine37-N1)-methyltransferase
MLRIAFVTLFPNMIRAAVEESILGRAAASGLVEYGYSNPRDFSTDKHKTVDDSPYGGGPGMLMKAETVSKAIDALSPGPSTVYVMPDPVAPLFRQADAEELAVAAALVFICGHYEGIDARVAEDYRARRYSIGDFVVTGGELPAALMADAVVRRIPGALGNAESLGIDSFSDGLLSAPSYTRPEVWRDLAVPEVLRNGHHAEMAKWKRRESLRLTKLYRPELLDSVELSKEDRRFLDSQTE